MKLDTGKHHKILLDEKLESRNNSMVCNDKYGGGTTYVRIG